MTAAFNSIRVRLIANTVLVCGAALFLAFASLVTIEMASGRRALIDEIGTIATIVGQNAAGAVTFDDTVYAAGLLAGLNVRGDIVRARIDRKDGTILATYERRFEPGQDSAGQAAGADAGPAGAVRPQDFGLFAILLGETSFVEVGRPIALYGDDIGRIRITADLSHMAVKLKLYTLVAGVGMLLLFLAAIFVSWRLYRSIYTDISDLVGAMAEIAGKGRYDIRARKNRNDELGSLVDGFNAMLEQLESRDEELHKTMVRAETANRAKSSFLAAISHELRTPLNAIIGFSEIMINKLYGPLGDEKYVDYSRDINQSGEHLLKLINDILDLSKIESGVHDLEDDVVDVAIVIEEAVKFVADRAHKGHVEIATEVAADLPYLNGDSRKVKQILLNLLSNAIKFTPPGGTVAQKAWRGEDGGVVLQTVDSGIGMAPEDIPKAMTVFGQIEDDLNRKYEGTGLGLPLSDALVQEHGGTLALQSALGEGTAVTVRFPPERSVQRGANTCDPEAPHSAQGAAGA